MDALDVLGKRYRLEWIDRTEGDYGECYVDQCKIEVALYQCLDQRRDTLLHEAMHAVDHEMNTGLRETQIRRLATGMLALFRQNPALVAYLTGE